MWKNGGIEILEIQVEDTVQPLPNGVDLWTFFGGAARATLSEKPEFTTVMLKNCTVKCVVRPDTAFYQGCGNANCQGHVKLPEGTCPHCPTEGTRKRWMIQFTLIIVQENASETATWVEFCGRQAMQMVHEGYLEANCAKPEIYDLNDKIEKRFPEGMKLDLVLWYRPTEGDDHVVSDPAKHVVMVRHAGGAPWESPEVTKVQLPTMSELLGASAGSLFRTPPPSPGRVPSSRPGEMRGPLSTLRYIVGLDNPSGTLCATNTLLQIIFHTPVLRKAVMELDREQNSHLAGLVQCVSNMAQGKMPSSFDRVQFQRLLQSTTLAAERHDPLACLPELWRELSLMWDISVGKVNTVLVKKCPNEHVLSHPVEESNFAVVHSTTGNLVGALELLTQPFAVTMECTECHETYDVLGHHDYGVRGNLLPILVQYPTSEGTSFQVPRQFTFAAADWEVMAVGEHRPSHWVAHVMVPTQKGLVHGPHLYTVDDERATLVPDSKFPVGMGCLVMAQRMRMAPGNPAIVPTACNEDAPSRLPPLPTNLLDVLRMASGANFPSATECIIADGTQP